MSTFTAHVYRLMKNLDKIQAYTLVHSALNRTVTDLLNELAKKVF